ncbi:hypothetical protein COV20_05115 [Candidatus Woesearchaeota archaeon CG10_big_fil_rev_8_21_14_0_10_45_16]|nr:MAG: hypothetical protein COV20_05115 [Candidatus Woesearchaeota archaeon CG10_big_fil_rev_8_21_14_0_10_45_16]
MVLYAEGIFWYVLVLDCLYYNYNVWISRKKGSHWLSAQFPYTKFLALWYLVLTAWLGYLLVRMQLLGF